MLVIQISTLEYKKALKVKNGYLLIEEQPEQIFFDIIYDRDRKIIYGENNKYRSHFKFNIDEIRKYINQSIEVVYTDLLTNERYLRIGKLTNVYSDRYLHIEVNFDDTLIQ